jgi:hypothetical protein
MNLYRARMLLMFSASVVAILVFSRMSAYSLFVLAFGASIMLMAFAIYYRPAALFGMLLVAISATMSMEVDTLIETAPLMAASVGLVVPMTMLTLFALSCESHGEVGYVQRRPTLVGASYIVGCLLSVPAVIAATALFFPHMSLRFYGMTEISILLMFSTVVAVALTSRGPE